MGARKQVGFRLSPETDKMLDELAEIAQQSRNDVIVGLITTEYDRVHGNPQMMKIIELFGAVKEQLKEMTEGGQAAKT